MSQLKKLKKEEKRRLLDANRGILSEIAAECEVTSSLVSRVYWGKATSGKVSAVIERRMGGLEVAR